MCFQASVECSVGRCRCSDCENPHGMISRAASDRANKKGGEDGSGGPRVTAENVRCKCSSTNCLKLYCECLRNDLVCGPNCACKECKNTEEEAGPTGERTRVRNEIIKAKGMKAFHTPKKRTGNGCSCTRSRCVTKYCDCNVRGDGCDPAVCSCTNCENMMKPLSEIAEGELRPEEDPTEVYVPDEPEDRNRLPNFSHLIDDFDDGGRIAFPKGTLKMAYISKDKAAEAAAVVREEETKVRSGLELEISLLEKQLEAKIEKEHEALEKYRESTNRVMCLEMEEPCRWNHTYQQLKNYVYKSGDLPPVPSACVGETERRLSIWVQEMKSLHYSKSEKIMNFPHRIEALESLGIEWIESSEERWNRMYDRLAAYKAKEGTVKLPSFMQCRKSKNKDLIALRHWLDVQEQDVKSGAMEKRRDRLKKLQDLGMKLRLTWEEDWKYYIVHLLKFRSKYGHLNLSGAGCDPDFEAFVAEVIKRIRAASLTKEELDDLRAKGLLVDLKNVADRRVNAAANKAGSRLVPLDRVQEVNYWAGMLEQLKAYQAKFKTLDFPSGRGGGCLHGPEYTKLRDWVEAQRRSYRAKTLDASRIDELAELGLDFDPWDEVHKKLRKYKKEAGTARLPKMYKCPDGEEEDEELKELCIWVTAQIKRYRKDELDADKKKKLRKLGVLLTKSSMGKVPWETRFEEMMEYYHDNKTCLPKRDGPLRQWVLQLVELIQNGFVSAKRQKMIDQERIGPYLRPQVIFKGSAKKKRKAASSGGGEEKKQKAEAV